MTKNLFDNLGDVIVIHTDYIQRYLINKERILSYFDNITAAFLAVGDVVLPDMILLSKLTEHILLNSGDSNYTALWENAPETLHILAGANPDLLSDVALYLRPIVERDRQKWIHTALLN